MRGGGKGLSLYIPAELLTPNPAPQGNVWKVNARSWQGAGKLATMCRVDSQLSVPSSWEEQQNPGEASSSPPVPWPAAVIQEWLPPWVCGRRLSPGRSESPRDMSDMKRDADPRGPRGLHKHAWMAPSASSGRPTLPTLRMKNLRLMRAGAVLRPHDELVAEQGAATPFPLQDGEMQPSLQAERVCGLVAVDVVMCCHWGRRNRFSGLRNHH